MKKFIKSLLLTYFFCVSAPVQAINLLDLLAVWIVAKTAERIIGVSDSCIVCCTCECKKKSEKKACWGKRMHNKKTAEASDNDNQIIFVIDKE